MNQLTTIAALPSGGGCMAALPSEVVADAVHSVYAPSAGRFISVPARPLFKSAIPADRQGFEPFDYTERS